MILVDCDRLFMGPSFYIAFLTRRPIHRRHMSAMGLLPDTKNCRLRMRRECRERFPRHRLQRKPLVSDPGTHHDTCVTHVPWSMSGLLTHGGGENVPDIPGACATRNFTYLARGPWYKMFVDSQQNGLTTKEISKLCIIVPLWGESIGHGWKHSQRAINVKVFPCLYVIGRDGSSISDKWKRLKAH